MKKIIITKVNEVDILVVHTEFDDFVPLTPIYKALGVKPHCEEQGIETKSGAMIGFVIVGWNDHTAECYHKSVRLKYSFAALLSLTPDFTDADKSKTFFNDLRLIYEALWDYAFNDNQKRIKSYQKGLCKIQKMLDEMDEIKQTD